MAIVWSDPPAAQHGSGSKHEEFANDLRDNPGVWATTDDGLLDDKANASQVQMIQKGRGAAYRPAGSFKAVARKNESGDRYNIFVRYIGENGEYVDESPIKRTTKQAVRRR
jgi:hypothetical protein